MEKTKVTFEPNLEEMNTAIKNAVLNNNQEEFHFLKVGKHTHEDYINFNEGVNNFVVANVRILTKYGDKKTIKVFVHPKVMDEQTRELSSKEIGALCIYSSLVTFNYKYEEVSSLSLENMPFVDTYEEAKRKRDEEEAKKHREKRLDELTRLINKNIKQCRSFVSAKRSYKKFSMDELMDLSIDLTISQEKYLNGVIDEINQGDKPKTTKEYISKLVGAKKDLFQQIEKTFQDTQDKVYENILEWCKKEYKHHSSDALNEMALEILELQKMKLFYNVGKHLNELDIQSVINLRADYTANGFEGSWGINLMDGSQKVLDCKSIIAHGYIQRMHYRYISHLKNETF